jgi:uncharacterized protein (DUF885 family)
MADMPLAEAGRCFPRHHLQLAIQMELKDVPAFRKFGDVAAYTEGWVPYSEKLAKDIDMYADLARDLGRLQMELHCAIRLVVDIRLKYKRWSREMATKCAEDQSADTPGGIVKAIEGYIIYPGQATTCMVGRLKISEPLDNAQKVLGKKFDVRGFHDTVLKSGPVPLDVLEEQVDSWIASRR